MTTVQGQYQIKPSLREALTQTGYATPTHISHGLTLQDVLEINHPSNPLTLEDKLNKLRHLMQKHKLDAYIINPSNKYNLEQTPLHENNLHYISNFSGDAGYMVVTQDKAYLIVDKRFHIQAPLEVNSHHIEVIKQPYGGVLPDSLSKLLKDLSKNHEKLTVGLGENNLVQIKNDIVKKTMGSKIDVTTVKHDLVDSLKKTSGEAIHGQQSLQKLYALPKKITGLTTQEKLALLRKTLSAEKVDALLVTNLESLAYLGNLRAYNIPYNSIFKGMGLITPNQFYIFTNNEYKQPGIGSSLNSPIQFFREGDFNNVLQKLMHQNKQIQTLGIIPNETNLNLMETIRTLGANIIELPEDPIKQMRIIKNHRELDYIQRSVTKTDKAFQKTIRWIHNNIDKKKNITEQQVADQLIHFFKKGGATNLSFKPIISSGSDIAILHKETYNKTTPLRKGELLLMDGGAFYKGGYATDLTRTILLGGKNVIAEPWQKKTYTTVLKSILQGILFPLEVKTSAHDLDHIVRKTNQEFDNFKYDHSTGHGIGISVHEYPPNIAKYESSKNHTLKPGMLFTLEPGLYDKNKGGVRIENIVSVEKKPHGKGSYLNVLSSASLDHRLIDYTMLTSQELDMLLQLEKCSKERLSNSWIQFIKKKIFPTIRRLKG